MPTKTVTTSTLFERVQNQIFAPFSLSSSSLVLKCGYNSNLNKGNHQTYDLFQSCNHGNSLTLSSILVKKWIHCILMWQHPSFIHCTLHLPSWKIIQHSILIPFRGKQDDICKNENDFFLILWSTDKNDI